MKLDFQRKIDRWVGSLLCWVFSLFPKQTKSISKTSKPQKILIILLSERGSLILANPMFERIKERYDDATVYALLFEPNKEVLELLNVVETNNIFTVRNTSFFQFCIDSISTIIKLRQLPIDTVIDCELFSRVSSIYTFLIGPKKYAGFHPHTQEGLFRGNYINFPVPYNPYHHISQQFLALVEALDSEQIPTVKKHVATKLVQVPPLQVSKQEITDYFNKVNADFPSIAGKKLILINPSGGLLPIRAWPLENFCYLAKNFLQTGYAVGIIGIKDDKKIAAQVVSECPDCIDLTGYTKSVRELMIIFHFASLLITNDGGPGHFAGMTPIPSIIFFGPETPVLYGSLNPDSHNFYVPLSCSPCLTAYNHRNSPCDGDNQCLQQIQPEGVLSQAYEILKKGEQ